MHTGRTTILSLLAMVKVIRSSRTKDMSDWILSFWLPYMGQLHQLVPVGKNIWFSIFTDLDSTWPRYLMVILQHVVPIYRNTRYFLLKRKRNAFYIALSIKICQKNPWLFKTAEVDLAILEWLNDWKLCVWLYFVHKLAEFMILKNIYGQICFFIGIFTTFNRGKFLPLFSDEQTLQHTLGFKCSVHRFL